MKKVDNKRQNRRFKKLQKKKVKRAKKLASRKSASFSSSKKNLLDLLKYNPSNNPFSRILKPSDVSSNVPIEQPVPQITVQETDVASKDIDGGKGII